MQVVFSYYDFSDRRKECVVWFPGGLRCFLVCVVVNYLKATNCISKQSDRTTSHEFQVITALLLRVVQSFQGSLKFPFLSTKPENNCGPLQLSTTVII